MSNILIIKHGSLGDLIQANGAMEDIKNSHKESKVILLTAKPYAKLMSNCPYLDGVIIDKRLPRWNLFFLFKLKKLLTRYNFSHVFDLQNSSRTKFYRNFILSKSIWSSSETILDPGQKKKDFDQEPVLKRMKTQLVKSGIKTKKINDIDLSWTFVNLDKLIKRYSNGNYILIFPFCSKKHQNKKWPYFKELIIKIKEYYKNKFPILIAPGPEELDLAKNLNAKIVLEEGKPIDLNKLITLINNARFIISNDTGPAHIASHLKKKGLVLFGSHTSASKVSIENSNFNAISERDLANLTVDSVLSEIKKNLY